MVNVVIHFVRNIKIMINKRSFIACFVGVFIGVFLLQVFMMMEFTLGFIETLQFIATFELFNRIVNTSIVTGISLMIIILIDPKIIFNKKQCTEEIK